MAESFSVEVFSWLVHADGKKIEKSTTITSE